MVLATLLWGATFVVVRDSLDHLGPTPLVALRFGCAAPILALASWMVRGRSAPDRRRSSTVRAALICGLVSGPLTAAGYLFQAIGLVTTSAGSSAFLTAVGSLMAAFFAWPILGQRPPAILVAGIGLALVGSALLGLREGLHFGIGEAWTLAGAAIYGIQIVTVAHWAARADVLLLTAVQAAITTVCVAPFAPFRSADLASLDPGTWARVGYLVLAGSVMAPALQVFAQRRLSAGRIGLLFALEPVFGLVFAVSLGGERYVARWWLGAALILSAVLLVEGHASRRGRARSRPASA
jgi:drug/metabolite transporter (DMT)-like permease